MSLHHVAEAVALELIGLTLFGLGLVWACRGYGKHEEQGTGGQHGNP